MAERPLVADRVPPESRRLVAVLSAAGRAVGSQASVRWTAGASIPGLALALALEEGWFTLTAAGASTAATLVTSIVMVITGRRIADAESAINERDERRAWDAAALEELAAGQADDVA